MKVIAARAARAGVPITTGTDVLERHGDMLLLELERLVDIGLTAQQVLVAATVTSAEAAQRPELGRVMVGAPASFIVDSNPLLDTKTFVRYRTQRSSPRRLGRRGPHRRRRACRRGDGL